MMSFEDMIAELRQLGRLSGSSAYQKLTGGTSSLVARLEDAGNRQVLKANEPLVLQAEAEFLTAYRNIDLFPNLHYADPQFRYLLFQFMPGTHEERRDQAAFLSVLVTNVINRYQKAPGSKKWGWTDEPVASWEMFLLRRVTEAREKIGNHLADEDFQLARSLIEKGARRRAGTVPYLLHGDLGVHNFLFTQGQLTGVIDPTPIYGEPIYDLMYAFCSSPDGLQDEAAIREAACRLHVSEPYGEEEIAEQVLLSLYPRIATCIHWHPQDLPAYRDAWGIWKSKTVAGGIS